MLMIGFVAPLATLAAFLTLCGIVLAMKWALIGRVRPGQHPLWSCWCSRWDFLYVAWNLYASPVLSAFEGTLWLPWYLRAMGMKIGKGVVLGPGFAQVVDPDMIEIGDGATVHAMFQAHTFEDRVLKIDRVRIRRHATVANGTVVLYGADIGEGTHVAPHSVVMKHERLAPGCRYEGAPTSLS
jgi:non-ribosomal peptide synthetase-like protein